MAYTSTSRGGGGFGSVRDLIDRPAADQDLDRRANRIRPRMAAGAGSGDRPMGGGPGGPNRTSRSPREVGSSRSARRAGGRRAAGGMPGGRDGPQQDAPARTGLGSFLDAPGAPPMEDDEDLYAFETAGEAIGTGASFAGRGVSVGGRSPRSAGGESSGRGGNGSVDGGPRDYQKENVRRMRAQERRNRQARAEADADAAARARGGFKIRKFDRVQSRVFAAAENTKAEGKKRRAAVEAKLSARRRGDVGAEAKGSARTSRELGTGPRGASNRGGKRAPAKAKASKRRVTKPRVPRVADLEAEFAERESEAASRAPRDYVTSNAVANITAKPKRRRGKKASFRHESYGKVPDYIIERRLAEQKAREVEEANRPDPDVPPGLTLMPEEERLETLRLLEENKDEVIKALNRMPIVVDTFGLKRRKNELESKLAEIDGAIKMFSRKKVFIDESQ